MDIAKIHRELCGQAAVVTMLARQLSAKASQAARQDGARRAYLHSARLLLIATGTDVTEAHEATDLVYEELLKIHEQGWVK